MDDTINILLSFDKKYAPISGVMLTSLLKSNRDCNFNVYAFVDGDIDPQIETKFSKLLAIYNSRWFSYNIEHDIRFRNIYINSASHITLPTYFRLLAAEILPNTVNKILYLDGDVIVNGDIKPLWNTDIDGYAFAGALDISYACPEIYHRLNYNQNLGYFNAGVTLFNISYWREHNIVQRIFDYIRINSENLQWMDQDALNGLLYNEKKQVDIKYNFQYAYFAREFWGQYDAMFQSKLKDVAKDPVIIHYSGPAKPWHYWCYGYPFFKLWRKTAKFSLWHRDLQPPMNKYYFKFLLKKMIFPTRILAMRNADMEEISYGL